MAENGLIEAAADNPAIRCNDQRTDRDFSGTASLQGQVDGSTHVKDILLGTREAHRDC